MQFIIHRGKDEENPGKWFETVYEENAEWLIRYAYSITENKSLAEDVVSEVFMVIWNKKDELSHVNDLQAYMTKSVRNLALKKISQDKKEQVINLSDVAAYKHDLDPESILIGKELESVISDVIENLSPHGRLVYDMARNKGFSNDKIANELGISKLTVRKHLSNVLKIFKVSLHRYYASKQKSIEVPVSKLICLILPLVTLLP